MLSVERRKMGKTGKWGRACKRQRKILYKWFEGAQRVDVEIVIVKGGWGGPPLSPEQ